MKIKHINGKLIYAYGYVNGTAHVRKNDGIMYSYLHIPESVGQAFLRTKDPDGFFAEHIEGKYGEHRVGAF